MDADPFWTARHVLVTGCTNFLGSWVTRFLVEANARVVGVVRDRVAGSELHRSRTVKKIDIVRGAVEDPDLLDQILDEHDIHTVFHFPDERTSPVEQIASVLEAVSRARRSCQVVVASSGLDEEEGMSADMLALSYAHTHGLPVCVAACGEPFGGGDLDFARLVPRAILAVLRDESPVLTPADQGGDRVYVKEAASAHLLLARRLAQKPNLAGRAFDFTGDSPLSGLELVKCILKRMRSPLKPAVQTEAIDDIVYPQFGTVRTRAELGWSPHYSLDTAIGETIAWYRDHFTVPMVRAA